MARRPFYFLNVRFPSPSICVPLAYIRYEVTMQPLSFDKIRINTKGDKLPFKRIPRSPQTCRSNRISIDPRCTEDEFIYLVTRYLVERLKTNARDILFAWEDNEKPTFATPLQKSYIHVPKETPI